MILFFASLGSVLASCIVFETKCKDTEFAYDLTVNETCLSANFAQLSLPCFQIGNCTLSKYKNGANEDLGLITGEKTVKLGFNENDKCFDKIIGDTISYTSNLTYSCPQESSNGIVTDGIYEFKDLKLSCNYIISPENITISQTIDSSAKSFTHLKTDNTTAEIKPNITYTVTVDGVTSPDKVELGKRVTVDFVWKSNSSEFHIDSCTAKGNKNEIILIWVKSGCPSNDTGTTIKSINPQVTNGTKFEFDQFAFVPGNCQNGWTSALINGKEKCFKYVGQYQMDIAASKCIEFEAELPLPLNKEENTDLYKVVQSFGLAQAALDGNDVAQEGVWRRSNEDLLTYFNWKSSAPNNYGGTQHYISYTPGGTGEWNDIWNEIRDVICQKEVNGTSPTQYEFAMDCSVKLGKTPTCSGHSVGRRSVDKDESISIQYQIETPEKVEGFANIMTSETKILVETNDNFRNFT